MLRRFTIDPDEPVVVRRYPNEPLAEFARALLDAADIPAMLLPNRYGEVRGSEVRLAVRRRDAEEAIRVLDEAARSSAEAGPPDPE